MTSQETATPINAIITTVCLNVFARAHSVYFSELKSRVERASGGPVDDWFLVSSLERQGYRVSQIIPWIVRIA